MPKYEFTVILAPAGELTEELSDRLFAAGCDDASPGQCEGTLSMDFHREAGSMEEAIRSAIEDVRAAGCEAVRVEIEPEAVPAPG